jgi:hypothetical protein
MEGIRTESTPVGKQFIVYMGNKLRVFEYAKGATKAENSSPSDEGVS